MEHQNRNHFILFCLVFVLLSWWFHYFEIFNYVPYATHSWRQADSSSFVQNYYNNGFQFFVPKIHHAVSGDSHASPSEFPILYYLTSLIWKITPPHDGVLRLINYSILLWGLFAISKFTLRLTSDIFAALMVPLFLMSSPVIAFYGFNYLPNIPALGFALVGISWFYNFVVTEDRKWLFGSWLVFLFAGLLKITVLVPFIAIFIIFLLEKILKIQFKSEGKIFKKGWSNLLLFLSTFLIIGSWIIWVKNYNSIHDCSIFITKSRPIWGLPKTEIQQTWDWILEFGARQYFHVITRFLILGLTIIIIFFLRKRLPKVLYTLSLLTTLGTLGCFLIFYRQFFIHNYYAIELMTYPVLIFISTFYFLQKNHPSIGQHILTRIAIFVFIIFNLNYARQTLEQRYSESFVFNRSYDVSVSKKMEAQGFLKNLDIEYPTKVIAIPDISPNFNLNYFNLTGWSEFALSPQPFEPIVTQKFIDAGAKYLIITDEKYLSHENLKPFLKHPLGNFENAIFVFDLRKY